MSKKEITLVERRGSSSPPPSSSSSLIGPWRRHSILAPSREAGLCAISLDEQEEAGLEQGDGEQGVGLMLLAEGKGEDWEALATAALTNPAPGFWPMCKRAGWLRKMEEGRPPPCPPEPLISTLLPPSRLERGSWPPLAARAQVSSKIGDVVRNVTVLFTHTP